MRKRSVYEKAVIAFRAKSAVRCPFKGVPPKDAKLFTVPQEVRGLIRIQKHLEDEAEEVLLEPGSHESSAWQWRHYEIEAVETFINRHLQTKHGRTRLHKVEFYAGWKFRFLLR